MNRSHIYLVTEYEDNRRERSVSEHNSSLEDAISRVRSAAFSMLDTNHNAHTSIDFIVNGKDTVAYISKGWNTRDLKPYATISIKVVEYEV